MSPEDNSHFLQAATNTPCRWSQMGISKQKAQMWWRIPNPADKSHLVQAAAANPLDGQKQAPAMKRKKIVQAKLAANIEERLPG